MVARGLPSPALAQPGEMEQIPEGNYNHSPSRSLLPFVLTTALVTTGITGTKAPRGLEDTSPKTLWSPYSGMELKDTPAWQCSQMTAPEVSEAQGGPGGALHWKSLSLIEILCLRP